MTVENHSYCVQQKTQSKGQAGQGVAWTEAQREEKIFCAQTQDQAHIQSSSS